MRFIQKKLTVFLVAMVTYSRSPSQNGSVITNESGKPSSGRSSPQKVMAQQKVTKDEGRKRNGEKCFLMKGLLYACSYSHRDTHVETLLLLYVLHLLIFYAFILQCFFFSPLFCLRCYNKLYCHETPHGRVCYLLHVINLCNCSQFLAAT